jgi:hypothetical protein
MLNETHVTDAGLANLKGLDRLELLEVAGTKVTAGGVDELEKALPNCKIVFGPSNLPIIVEPAASNRGK